MTEQQQLLVVRVEELLFCVNDSRLTIAQRGAAYYLMEKHRKALQEQRIETTIIAGRIEIVGCPVVQEN